LTWPVRYPVRDSGERWHRCQHHLWRPSHRLSAPT